jgi:hypothetical protein
MLRQNYKQYDVRRSRGDVKNKAEVWNTKKELKIEILCII